MIEILMATYNGEKYLHQQLDSILNQTEKDIRILIRDDGSNDRTMQIIDSYSKKYPETIVLISDDKHCGSASKNFMELIKHATAEYIMFSDQDDVWLPNKVEESLRHMKIAERTYGTMMPILVFGDYVVVDENLDIRTVKSRKSKYNLELSNLLVQNCVTGCLMMANRELYTLIGEYKENILMHDWWIALIAAAFGKVYHFDKKVMLYRQHSENCVGAVDTKSSQYRLGRFLDKNTKKRIVRYLQQAMALKEEYAEKMPYESKLVLDRFINLFELNKIGKIKALFNGKYLKDDFAKILGQIIYF